MNASDVAACRRNIVVVYSPGGGNGKSEIAANLACRFSMDSLKTWVIDANLFAPTQHLIFGFDGFSDSLSDVLVRPECHEIPIYDISPSLGCDMGACFLTPASTPDAELRHLVPESLRKPGVLDALPGMIFSRMLEFGIEVVIIDTHPSFEEVNEVWLGITEFLLVVSRMNDLDRENLSRILGDGSVSDIDKKLVVFNNVRLDAARKAIEGMDNDAMMDLFLGQHIESEVCRAEWLAGGYDACEVYQEPFVYSPAMARYGETVSRDGLFIQRRPEDSFTGSLNRLAAYILAEHFVLGER